MNVSSSVICQEKINDIFPYETSYIEEIFYVAMYLRLSREDEDKGFESQSIEHQRDFLLDYISKHENWILVDIYKDDGFTGTDFNRPDFQRMIRDIEKDRVNLVITKDLSRLGRDYIDTGHYVEKYFPTNRVRYIAVNDGIDTFKKENSNNEMTGFKSIINDMYARDISKKVRTAKRTQAMKGQFVGSFAAYGYKKSENSHLKIEVDKEVAPAVEYIFDSYLSGKGLSHIARQLNEKGIDIPSVYKRKTTKYHNKAKTTLWGHSTVRKILTNEIYTGTLIQHKGEMVSYKVHKYRGLPEQEHIVIEKSHEAIIPKEKFDLVQQLLKSKSIGSRKKQKDHLLSGLLYCPRCGKKYNFQIQNGLKDDMVAICSTYNRFGKEHCSRVAIRESMLDKLIIDDLRQIKINRQELISQIDLSKQNEKNKVIEKQIESNKIRVDELLNFIKNAYTDKVSGLLTTEEYIRYVEDFRKEKEECNKKISLLEKELVGLEEKNNDEEVLKLIHQILEFDIINKQMIYQLIHKIEIVDKEHIHISYKFSN